MITAAAVAAEETDTFLDVIYGAAQGYLHTASGTDPFLNQSGKYKHGRFAQEHHRWPERRAEVVAKIRQADANDADFYVVPCVLKGTDRAKGTAVERLHAHTDV